MAQSLTASGVIAWLYSTFQLPFKCRGPFERKTIDPPAEGRIEISTPPTQSLGIRYAIYGLWINLVHIA